MREETREERWEVGRREPRRRDRWRECGETASGGDIMMIARGKAKKEGKKGGEEKKKKGQEEMEGAEERERGAQSRPG
eukprot:2949075-Rhodomonas_salina.1